MKKEYAYCFVKAYCLLKQMESIVKKFILLSAALLTSACQSAQPRIAVNTQDGQALPRAVVTGGASQATVTKSITVPTGKQTRIEFTAFINPDCTNVGYATVREAEAPASGTLEIKQAQEFGFFPPANPRSACNKQRVPGVSVSYRSKPGFVGIDNVTYEVFGPTTGLRRMNVTINVL